MTSIGSGLDHVKFTQEEIELAQLFKAYGLPWEPAPGQFVLDQSELIETESPFQHRVYFILDLQHFLRRSGDLEGLRESMCWLPTWEEIRQVLRENGIQNCQVIQHLESSQALQQGTERLELYRLLEEHITENLEL